MHGQTEGVPSESKLCSSASQGHMYEKVGEWGWGDASYESFLHSREQGKWGRGFLAMKEAGIVVSS